MAANSFGNIDFASRSGRGISSLRRARPGLKNREQNNSTSRRGGPFAGLQPINPVLLSSISVPLMTLVTIVNATVICVILRKRRLRTLRNMPLLSLAIADLLTGILVGPLFVTAQLTTPNGLYCTSYLLVETLCYTASLTNMFVVAIERSVAIFKPLRYSRYLTPSVVWSMAIFAWILSFLIAVARPRFRANVDRRFCVQPIRRTSVYSTFFASYFVVLSLIMVVMQVKMYKVVKSHRRRIVPSSIVNSVDELATTVRYSETPEFTLNSAAADEAGQRIVRNNNTRRNIDTVALTLVQTDVETRRPSIITRVFVTEQSEQREGTHDQTIASDESALPDPNDSLHTTDLIAAVAESFAISDGLDAQRLPRPSVCTIYRDGERVLGLQLQRTAQKTRPQRRKSDNNPTQFASLMYLTFIPLWVPYIVVLLMINFGYLTHSRVIGTVSTKVLILMNSLLNPFVHTIRMKEFRKSFKGFIRRQSSG